MMMSQILKFVDSPETRKTKYFENEKSDFLHIKIPFIIHSFHSFLIPFPCRGNLEALV